MPQVLYGHLCVVPYMFSFQTDLELRVYFGCSFLCGGWLICQTLLTTQKSYRTPGVLGNQGLLWRAFATCWALDLLSTQNHKLAFQVIRKLRVYVACHFLSSECCTYQRILSIRSCIKWHPMWLWSSVDALDVIFDVLNACSARAFLVFEIALENTNVVL